jgi:hypothetical protein
MDTILIDGKEVPITEVTAFYARKAALESELATSKQSLSAANQQLSQASRAVEAIERAKRDPQFARELADTLRTVHQDSAFFKDQTPPPAQDDGSAPPPAPEGGTQVLPQGAPAVAAPVDLALARQVEVLQQQINSMQADQFVTAQLEAVSEKFPSLNPEDVLKRALEDKLPVEHLGLVASDMERERLEGIVNERTKQNNLLDQLMNATFSTGDTDDQLEALGSSLSSAQLSGEAAVDWGQASMEDMILASMAEVGIDGSNSPT